MQKEIRKAERSKKFIVAVILILLVIIIILALGLVSYFKIPRHELKLGENISKFLGRIIRGIEILF